MKFMVGSRSGGEARTVDADERLDGAWRLVQAIGFALLVMGAVDILLAWAPWNFGNADWEFGTASATLNSMPVPAMGVALLAAGSIARRSVLLTALAASWSVIVVLGLCAVGLLYLLDVPLAMRAAASVSAQTDMRIAIAKALMAFGAYTSVHAYVILSCARVLR